MSYHLDFAIKHNYDSRQIGITIKTVLRRNNLFVVCDAKVDTGSEFCLFDREFGERSDIEIESGHRQNLSTLTGSFVAYGHEIELETLRSCLKRGEKQLREQEFDIFHCYFFIDLPENEKLTM